MAICDVTDLDVYNRALKNLKQVYRLANQIPEDHKRLRIQLINSAESIPPLIAEGFAKRRSVKELKRFLDMAMGSSDETITHTREVYLLADSSKRIDKELCVYIGKEYKIISKQLNNMIKKWVKYN